MLRLFLSGLMFVLGVGLAAAAPHERTKFEIHSMNTSGGQTNDTRVIILGTNGTARLKSALTNDLDLVVLEAEVSGTNYPSRLRRFIKICVDGVAKQVEGGRIDKTYKDVARDEKEVLVPITDDPN